ncbi:hypothetical protein IKF76_00315, partial [Candidatus Saccharibacteria bacterium]|nr:hypothetical protein [Candidatus Saccharibacteria bacterium]
SGGGEHKRHLEYIIKKTTLSIGLFCIATILSAVFYSSIGISSEVNQSAFADNTGSNSTISLRVTKNGSDVTGLDLNLSPTASGTFARDNLGLLVATDNATGYKLDFSDADDNTAMTHTSSTVTAAIPSITADTDESSFPVNSWGYSLDDIAGNQTFSPIPASSSPTTLKTTTTPTTSLPNGVDQTDITFAVKADTNLPAGTYKDTVVFSVVANYVPSALEQLSNMQDMTPAVCNAANIGDEATLIDTRDNKTYNIRKMEDGKCWMIQNLALGSTTGDITLTPADSNVSTDFTIPSSAVQTSGTASWGNSDVRVFDNGNAWIQPTSSGSNATVNTTGTPPSQSQYIGNYYNWYTATAGTGTAAMTSGVATSSICPKGWRLPTSNSTTADFNAMTNSIIQLDTNANNVPDKSFVMQSAPHYFNLAGNYNGGANYRGVYGNWWSSTPNTASYGYSLRLSRASVHPQYYGSRAYGFSVRCVAENQDLTTISTMQQMTPEICSGTTIGDETILRDARDNKTYNIRKMEDNKCWMTQNLRLGSASADITLTPSDSDVLTDFTIPASAVETSGITTWNYDEIRVYDNGDAWIQPTSAGANATVNTTGTPPSQSQYIGNYYNWYTATAATGTYSTTSGTVTSSICPKGWKLPTGGANSDFTKLTGALVGITADTTGVADKSFILQSPPNYFILSGSHANDVGATNQGNTTAWWSRTAASATAAYYLALNLSQILPQHTYSTKMRGFPIRCLVQ